MRGSNNSSPWLAADHGMGNSTGPGVSCWHGVTRGGVSSPISRCCAGRDGAPGVVARPLTALSARRRPCGDRFSGRPTCRTSLDGWRARRQPPGIVTAPIWASAHRGRALVPPADTSDTSTAGPMCQYQRVYITASGASITKLYSRLRRRLPW